MAWDGEVQAVFCRFLTACHLIPKSARGSGGMGASLAAGASQRTRRRVGPARAHQAFWRRGARA
jgi:hypothetical protein